MITCHVWLQTGQVRLTGWFNRCCEIQQDSPKPGALTNPEPWLARSPAQNNLSNRNKRRNKQKNNTFLGFERWGCLCGQTLRRVQIENGWLNLVLMCTTSFYSSLVLKEYTKEATTIQARLFAAKRRGFLQVTIVSVNCWCSVGNEKWNEPGSPD